MNTRAKIEARLRGAEMKMTAQRLAILEYLVRDKIHPTADQISTELNRHFPRASRATIYNTLHALRDASLVREIYINDAVARYDANLAPHYHFVCRACGKLEDVAPLAAGEMPQPAAGYTVEVYEIVLRGVCAACATGSRVNNLSRKR